MCLFCALPRAVCAGAPRLITALHVASYHNQEDMVQLLLNKGIKVRHARGGAAVAVPPSEGGVKGGGVTATTTRPWWS